MRSHSCQFLQRLQIMNLEYLAYSVMSALAALLYYKFYKWWQQMASNKSDAFFAPRITLDAFKKWLIIVGFSVASIVFLFKAIG